MVLVWFIILIVPIYDFIASNGIGYHIGYWIPGNENILLNFDFIGKTGMIGPTIGQKFMALISSILVGAYAWLKTQNHARGITAGIAVYAISIIYSIIPALISITLKIQLTEMINLLSIFWIALILLQGIIWLKIWKNKDF